MVTFHYSSYSKQPSLPPNIPPPTHTKTPILEVLLLKAFTVEQLFKNESLFPYLLFASSSLYHLSIYNLSLDPSKILLDIWFALSKK